jgi:flagellar assembly factor FliW
VTQPLELAAGAMVLFPEGLPGFESSRRFILLRHEDYDPFLFLQDLDNNLVNLPVVPVQTVDQQYRLELDSRDLDLLGFSSLPRLGADVVCLLVVILSAGAPEAGAKATCNLFAPIVINPATMRGKQVMQIGSDYPSMKPLETE